jgi:predicted nucleotidyltransferase
MADGILGAMDTRRRRSAIEARESAERAARYLASDPGVKLVYGFGSAIQGDRATVRDVDLAILTDRPLTLEDLTKRQADVISVTSVPIDLVSLNDASIVLAHEVVESGVCLYARTPEAETEFVTRARARYWDFRPYRDEQWRLAGQRLAERLHGS